MSIDEKNFTSENFLHVMCQLKSQQKYLDRLSDTSIFSIKNSLSNTEFLQNFQEMNKNRQWGNKVVTKQLIDIIVARKKLKRDVNDKNKLRDLDISYFKSCIQNIEKEIGVLKNQTNLELERLEVEETELTDSINKIISKKELFDNEEKKPSPKYKHGTFKTSGACMSQEVVGFMNFLQSNGGHEGGWGVDDHHIFLKYYKQNEKDITQLIRILAKYLPEYADEDIIGHVEWYIEYESKKEKYKNALADWKYKNKSSKINSPKIQPIVEIKKRSPENSRIYIKEKIAEWKENKLKQLEKEKEELMLNQLSSKKSKVHFDKREQIKMKIQEWKSQQEAEKRELQKQQKLFERTQREERVNQAKRLIKEFQTQDKQFLKRRHELKKSNENNSKFVRFRSLSLVTVDRDRDRALADTKQSLARSRRPSTEEIKIVNSMHSSIHVNNIPKLKRPEWVGMLPYI